MLWNKGDRGMSLRYDASAVAARELGIIIQPLGVSEPDDFIKASRAARRHLNGLRLAHASQSQARIRVRCRATAASDLRDRFANS